MKESEKRYLEKRTRLRSSRGEDKIYQKDKEYIKKLNYGLFLVVLFLVAYIYFSYFYF